MLSPLQSYLLIYNAFQTFGWSIILCKVIARLVFTTYYGNLYQYCELELKIFQTAAILEILHAALGFVRSPVVTTAIQVYSRVSLVWLILNKAISTQLCLGVLFILIAWSVTEVVRYSYYGLSLINAVSKVHTWLRYSLFIVLYPLGVVGELLIILGALPEVAVRKHFTLELPNMANFGFSFWWYLIIYMVLYLPGSFLN
ncbi:unnamed protein product [Thelazia callipaeda]|uniref:Very-long-chain (3R)-3-hydroxyacyl-CoA dehydratase n=1 Tax=Thelazia callipaeda TaxID=103827 RepID=A0A0N5D787_THECL|nr:unnamed protein product [Thelazia callipaeda]